MMRKNRKLLIVVTIVVLVALNVWRWRSTSTSLPSNVVQTTQNFSLEDFEVKAIPTSVLPPMTRDIFHPKAAEIKKLPMPVKADLVVVQLPPTKSPEELAKESAQAEFSQIRCVGVSIRNERMQAYLINVAEPVLVSAGDKVGNRFVVEKILTDGVSLRDAATGVGGKILISGK